MRRQFTPHHTRRVFTYALPLLLIAACAAYPYFQYALTLRYLDKFVKELGLTEQDRLTPAYRYCSGIVIPKCGVNVNYQLTRTDTEFWRDLEALGQPGQFSGSLFGSTMVININLANSGSLAVNIQTVSNQTPENMLPDGGSLDFVDYNGRSFGIERYRTGSSQFTYTLNGKQIRGDVITIRLEY